MIIGVPKEIKANENRVALLPVGAQILIKNNHKVILETNAGSGSGFSDDDYKAVGVEIANKPEEIFKNADMIMKVKEPINNEYKMIREGQIIFTYFHFAASKELTEAIMKSKCVAIAYETVQKEDRSLPLLIPMSEVAGRMAPQEGAKYLEMVMGGRGVLLGGVPGTGPAEVMVLGGGVVGTNAAKIAAGFGARVTIFDNNLYRLRYLDDVMPKNVMTAMSNEYYIRTALPNADLVIGAVLIPGAKAPKLVTREMLKIMKEGSVIVDVSVDQGGCIETCRPTTHENPTYVIDGVLHYCVANMPGAVPHTSTLALTNATLPYAVEIANKGFEKAIKTNKEIKFGLNIIDGKIVYKGVADAFGFDYYDVNTIIN
ncbi:MAG: alanine dehydrogenase [Ignavibacteria bacterium GWA2_35_9]|nr:MAG: alanine dehydrogenase [Ignavibacteria bacterium GWA2_35_9]OGU48230.1 MAG: alanine dehydrogenase [Ignavibacteria bacterium GWB2_36_8]OGU49422.1 MAG: alanine dehydrogenase [Ignavibacteria bacterium GWC2_36_12]